MRTFSVVVCVVLLLSCNKKSEPFGFLNANKTGISFNNQIPDSDIINILSYEYIYNGGGVGAGDFNNDGLQDLFFTGNLVDNALYLNKGNLKFEDVSKQSMVGASGKWCTGVSIVDINHDGWMDIYVSVTSFNTNERPDNLLFINQGLNDQGIPTFNEQAKTYGIESGKHSIHAAFFDYDLDGDLDLYVLNNVLDLVSPTDYRTKQVDGNAPNNDQLFRNDGDNQFTDVSKEAGIVIEGYGLGLAISDFNNDGFPDLYVANDYITNDLLFINQGDGTFKNEIAERLSKQSKFSMGVNTADLDNDGDQEIYVLDMLALNNERLKKLNSSSQYNNVLNNKKFDYQEQNVRNMLQGNLGDGTFTEVAYQAGVFATDWSWSPLMEDFDNDGDIDIYVTNGFPKDITDLDFINYKANRNMSLNRADILNEIPIVRIPNVYFENQGQMNFEEKTAAMNLDNPSFSNGAIAVDLDQDGDLDIVTNNINQQAFIIENNTSVPAKLTIRFDKSALIGTKVYAYKEDQVSFKEFFPHTSYMSSSPYELLFTQTSDFDSIKIIYPNLKSETLKGNQIPTEITLNDMKGEPFAYPSSELINDLQIDTIGRLTPINFDANLQTTILTDYTHNFPKIVNEDMIITGEGLHIGGSLIQDVTAAAKISDHLWLLSKGAYHRSDSLGSLQLIERSGKPVDSAFDQIIGNYSVLTSCDYDLDNDNDLFLGGSYKYGQYPLHYDNMIAVNHGENGWEFKKLSYDFAPQDAAWADLDGDGYKDLLLTGHWQGLAVFANNKGELISQPKLNYAGTSDGLFFTIAVSDYNDDGIDDVVLGNIGTNTNFQTGPIKMIAEDFDQNGTIDPLVFFNYNRQGTLVPLDLKDELISQVPRFKKDYTDYSRYTKVTIDTFLNEESRIYNSDHTHSLYLTSSEQGHRIDTFPNQIDRAPVLVASFLSDTLFMGGNISYGREFWGSFNGSTGSWLKWDTDHWLDISSSFPRIKGDIRSIFYSEGTLLIGKDENQIVTVR
ncbi:VCBS repeat-containing protein [Portibacter marinus]|uniref:VCBS repeat-containing protein n=1 Tax=Portibacter marinus TaxID=2898660 RepID=UPI001F431D49|nr:VCBS repeat-containing protein [Portibacter marinus]